MKKSTPLAAPAAGTRYWRPCLPATLTPEQRAQVVTYAKSLQKESST